MNPHHANIGDVVKHLMLAELLHRSPPKRYIESHSGAPDYALRGKVGRTHDAMHMLRDVQGDEHLESSEFVRLLLDTAVHKRYPASPSVALHSLGNHADYVFFDLVEDSLKQIQRAAHQLGINHERVSIRKEDGLAGAENFHEEGDFVFLDPFRLTDTYENGPDTLQVFDALSKTKTTTLLWYPLIKEEDASQITSMLPSPPHRVDFWLDEPTAGLSGCGMAGFNINETAWEKGLALLDALSHAWGADLSIQAH